MATQIFPLIALDVEPAGQQARQRFAAFELDCHPADFHGEIYTQRRALLALMGGAKLQDMTEREQIELFGLVDRLGVLESELVDAGAFDD